MAKLGTGTEVTPEVARSLWKTHAIFAYDDSHKVEWQLNIDVKTCMCKIDEAVKDGCTIFIENS